MTRNIEDPVIAARKDDHLTLGLQSFQIGRFPATGLEDFRFEHCALPEMALEDVDLSTSFLGRALKAPLLISSLTGGTERAGVVNANLAAAAQRLGIGLAVGSQRIALEGHGSAGLDGRLRELAPDIPLLANIGGAQLVAGYSVDEARRAVEMIGADGLIVHLNPLQEIIQPEGDRNWRGVLDSLAGLIQELECPVIVKEVGAGLSATVARKLVDAGVHAVDVAGMGGTNWAAIEARRIEDPAEREMAQAFAGWGIPTARAIVDVHSECPDALLIASGGIRTGIEAAVAIRLGADLVGQAAAAGIKAVESADAVVRHFGAIIAQMRMTCFLTGSRDLSALRKARLL